MNLIDIVFVLPYWIESGVELLVYFWHLKRKQKVKEFTKFTVLS